MNKLISLDNVIVLEGVNNWEEAVIKSAEPLLKKKSVKQEYIDKIIKNTKELGPYYVIAPYVAMPHAKPEDGVIKQQISILLLKKPIKFSENGFDVCLIITLAATDYSSHLETLKKLAEILGDETKIGKIIESNTREEVFSYFNF